MNNVKMVALRTHPFGTGTREAGEEYEATPEEAKTLQALKWARPVGKSEAPAAANKATEKVAKKQAYNTRDLRAKG